MGLITHAERELRRAGLFDEASDYRGMIGNSVMDLICAFADARHSGGSAELTLAVFEKLARFKPLTPLTDDPAEWRDVSEYYGGQPMWQSIRNPACFSTDGGKTHYDVDEEERQVRPTEPAARKGAVT